MLMRRSSDDQDHALETIKWWSRLCARDGQVMIKVEFKRRSNSDQGYALATIKWWSGLCVTQEKLKRFSSKALVQAYGFLIDFVRNAQRKVTKQSIEGQRKSAGHLCLHIGASRRLSFSWTFCGYSFKRNTSEGIRSNLLERMRRKWPAPRRSCQDWA